MESRVTESGESANLQSQRSQINLTGFNHRLEKTVPNGHLEGNADLLSLRDPYVQYVSRKVSKSSDALLNAHEVTLHIQIVGDDVCFRAGTTLRGHIFLEFGKELQSPPRRLNLYLKGFEETEFAHGQGRAQIIREVFPIAMWSEGHTAQVGKYVFPFDIELPDWLPASLCLFDHEK